MLKETLLAFVVALAQAAVLSESKAESNCCVPQQDLSSTEPSLFCRLKNTRPYVYNSLDTDLTFSCEDPEEEGGAIVGEVTIKCLRGSCAKQGIDPYVHIKTGFVHPLAVYVTCGPRTLRLKNIWSSRTTMFCPEGDYNAFGWPIEDCPKGQPVWVRRLATKAASVRC